MNLQILKYYLLLFIFYLSAFYGVFAHELKKMSDLSHPRLYFNFSELKQLKRMSSAGLHKIIYDNIMESAEFCLQRPIRADWIAPVSPDPIYLNLYDRFYAMMHDTAVTEHLAFAYAYSGEDKYLQQARKWLMVCADIWSKEARGDPDANKAYAVMRVLKGMAVGYDILSNDISECDRQKVKKALVDIGDKYYQWYLDNPEMAGSGQNLHHGSVEAASFGVTGLALIGDYEPAKDWVDLMSRKHTDFLLARALVKSGTQEQTSNFWASTMQYRIMFMDALRRVTGRDLFKEYRQYMKGDIALAAIVSGKKPGSNEDNKSVIFAPSYGQLDYWSPVLLYIAKEYNRPVYQYMALRDESLGSIQKTRYITPNGEQLMFAFGGYAYAWYHSSIKADIEDDLPLSFIFPEVNEAYVRDSYKDGNLVLGIRNGNIIIHNGISCIICEVSEDKKVLSGQDTFFSVSDEKDTTIIKCVSDLNGSRVKHDIEFERTGIITVNIDSGLEFSFWCHEKPMRKNNTLMWHCGTELYIKNGTIKSFEPQGYVDKKTVGLGKLKINDPSPTKNPLIKIRPENNSIQFTIQS